MSFAKLAEELGALATAASVTPESTPAGGAGADGGQAGGTETSMVKSFSFTLEDGTVVEAEDGADLVKSLIERFDTQAKTHEAEKVDLMKALGSLSTLVKAQGEALARLSGQGRGRMSTVAMPADAGAGAGAGAPVAGKGPEAAQELMAKAHAALAAGRINGVQVAMADGYLGKGMALPADLLNRINGTA